MVQRHDYRKINPHLTTDFRDRQSPVCDGVRNSETAGGSIRTADAARLLLCSTQLRLFFWSVSGLPSACMGGQLLSTHETRCNAAKDDLTNTLQALMKTITFPS
jgi:hypothetical protein